MITSNGHSAQGEICCACASGGSVVSGFFIVDGTIYWGSGHSRRVIGDSGNNKLYAFSLPKGVAEEGR